MQKTRKDQRPAAELPKGFVDVTAEDLQATERMLETIRRVYHSYGFEPLDTPAIEYTEALGKFLPDQDRPNEGVFSFQDVAPEAREGQESGKWLSLRYDLTAPLARYVAQNFDKLPKPFRRYAVGPVWRNEKPGPGRFRQFMQFDADTVGTDSVAADAEICMLAADTMEALGIARGQYVIKVSNRKVLDGLLVSIGIDPQNEADAARRMNVLRAVDKFDRLGAEAVRLLLGPGRKDDSGDFTKGVGLERSAIEQALSFLFFQAQHFESTASRLGPGPGLYGRLKEADYRSNLANWERIVGRSEVGRSGVQELREMAGLFEAAGYRDRIDITSEVVRGLEYYTGPVFEAELTFQVKNEDGQTVRFGSVGGGGRYDGLVERFLGQKVPATGFSMGVSRLQTALAALGRAGAKEGSGPVVVLVMDRAELPRYQRMAQTLRQAGIRAEMYLGTSGMKAQMKYADRRGSPCVVIQGGDEIAKGEVQIKDLIEGAKAAATIKDSKEWREGRPAQVSVPEADLVKAVREVLERHRM